VTSPFVTDVVHRVAGYGLPETPADNPKEALDDTTWDAVLTAVCSQRVTGHFVRALDDGAFAATDSQQAAAVQAHERALAVALVLERLLLTTVGLLHDAKMATRVLRGPAVAHTIYPEPGMRSFGDIDLLVADRDYDSAVAKICEYGARRRYEEPRQGFDRRFGKGVCLETPNSLEIDLHRTLVAGPFGLAVDTEALFDRATPFALGGETLDGLDPEARFLDACFHAALKEKQQRLVAVRDVAQMVLCAELATARVQELCHAWRCGVLVRRAIALAWNGFAIDAAPDIVVWARAYEPTKLEWQALHSYVGADRSYARQAVAGLHALHGFRARIRYAAALLVPTREYVRARDGGYLRRARRGVRLLADDWWRRRRVSRA
jgi:hypothetical protein